MTAPVFSQSEIDAALQSGQLAPNLPPAGYKRDEVLAERKDALEQQAEIRAEGRGTINPKVFEEDREIQHAVRRGFLDVDVGPIYIIKWVNYVSQHGHAVWEAKAEGWSVVTASMVKDVDRDLVREDGSLRVGDTICMCMRKDDHMLMERQRAERQSRIQHGFVGELHDIAKGNEHAFKILDGIENQNPHWQTMEKRAAARTALRTLGGKMKTGPVPGIPIK